LQQVDLELASWKRFGRTNGLNCERREKIDKQFLSTKLQDLSDCYCVNDQTGRLAELSIIAPPEDGETPVLVSNALD